MSLNLNNMLTPERLTKSAARTKGFIRDMNEKRIMSISEYWNAYGNEITEMALEGSYRFQSYLSYARKFAGGKKRVLSIPRPIDMVLYKATAESLMLYFNPVFSKNSYGFRKDYSAQKAIISCINTINSGYRWVEKLDILHCFDEINLNILRNIICKTDLSGDTVQWLYRILAVPLGNSTEVNRIKGISQGSPLSPVLANLYLNELDVFLDTMNIKYMRYADDIILFSKNMQSAKRTSSTVVTFLKKELKLDINETKRILTSTNDVKILGYCVDLRNRRAKLYPPQLDFSSIDRKITGVVSMKYLDTVEKLDRLGLMNRGWSNYFQIADIESETDKLEDYDDEEKAMILEKINPSIVEIVMSNYVSRSEWLTCLSHRKCTDVANTKQGGEYEGHVPMIHGT